MKVELEKHSKFLSLVSRLVIVYLVKNVSSFYYHRTRGASDGYRE